MSATCEIENVPSFSIHKEQAKKIKKDKKEKVTIK